jgi:hypothetical protein
MSSVIFPSELERKSNYNIGMINLYNNYLKNCKTVRTETILTKKEDYERMCNKFKNDIKKAILNSTVDTIGINAQDPTKWNIPDNHYQQLLIDLNFSPEFIANNEIIQETIQKRKNAKTMSYRIKKISGIPLGGKTKRRRARARKTKTKRRNRKSRKHYKK